MTDLIVVLRRLRSTPVITGVIVLSLSFGIFLNVAVWGIFYPNVRNPSGLDDREVYGFWVESGGRFGTFGDAEIQFLREHAGAFSQTASRLEWMAPVSQREVTQKFHTAKVSSNYFDLMGVPLRLGGGPRPGRLDAVISRRLHEIQFNASPQALGKQLEVNFELYEIVGIADDLTGLDRSVDVWITPHPRENRKRGLNVLLGTLKPGTSPRQAEQELQALHDRYIQENTVNHEGAIRVVSLDEAILKGRFPSRAQTYSHFLILLLFASLTYVIACANVSCLIMMNFSQRSSDELLRIALGADWRRLARLLVLEVGILCAAASAIGLLIAVGGRQALVAALGELLGPTMAGGEWTGLIALGIVLLIGAFLLALAVPMIAFLRFWRGSGQRKNILSRSLHGRHGKHSRLLLPIVVGQVTVSFVIFSLGLLTFASSRKLSNAQLGINTEQVVLLDIQMSPQEFAIRHGTDESGFAQYSLKPSLKRFFLELPHSLKTLNGVIAVGATREMDSESRFDYFRFRGQEPLARDDAVGYEPPDSQSALLRPVSPDFLKTLDVGVLRGRDFAESDFAPSARPVMIISHSMAERYWPDSDPLGQEIEVSHTGLADKSKRWFHRIIGVVENIQFTLQENNRTRAMYIPYVTLPEGKQSLTVSRMHMSFFIRFRQVPANLEALVRSRVSSIGSRATIERIIPLETALQELYRLAFAYSRVFSICSLVVLLLSCVGSAGIVAFSVKSQRREICIKKALGAQDRTVIQTILFRFTRLFLLAFGLGSAVVVFSVAELEGALPGLIESRSELYLTSAGLLFLALFSSAYFSSRLVLRLDPAKLLRD